MKLSPRTETDRAAQAAFAQNTSTHTEQTPPVFRPKRRINGIPLVLESEARKAAWPRFRVALCITLLVHSALLGFVVYWPSAPKPAREIITEIQFEEETSREEISSAVIAPRVLSMPSSSREVKRVEERRDNAQEQFGSALPQTNPNAGGASPSSNTMLDLPGMIGALNTKRPPARGAGSRSFAGLANESALSDGAQMKLERNLAAIDEAVAALGDFTSNSFAPTNAFRNRTGNGFGQDETGVGVALGKGTGAGTREGTEPGGLFGGVGGGATLGGGGYGKRVGRGAGNGYGNGMGNGTEIGIALPLGNENQTMNLQELIAWMKAHPGALPKLVQYDMEHNPGDLAAAVSFNAQGKQYELFLSCNEADLLLRICLIQGRQFTLLKDNGIKETSNYLATGEVVRAGATIQSLITSRQAPGETASQFYRIFWQWWEGKRR